MQNSLLRFADGSGIYPRPKGIPFWEKSKKHKVVKKRNKKGFVSFGQVPGGYAWWGDQ